MTKRRKPKGPGQHHRMGLTVKQLFGIVPNEQIGEDWFEKIMWASIMKNGNADTVEQWIRFRQNPVVL